MFSPSVSVRRTIRWTGDFERFTADALDGLAKLFVGKTVIADHMWSSSMQTARIYDAAVEKMSGTTVLVLFAYMLRNDQTAATIAAVEGGILREVSVGCAMGKATCSICGADKTKVFANTGAGVSMTASSVWWS